MLLGHGPSFMSAFVFSINLLILSGFSLTSFHLVEASQLSASLWFYKCYEMSFIYNYPHF